jgi:hypothetical protein
MLNFKFFKIKFNSKKKLEIEFFLFLKKKKTNNLDEDYIDFEFKI